MAASQTGQSEIFLEYGGDWQLDETGDLLLAIDSRDNGLATQQRLERLILTSPTLVNDAGVPIAPADDIFNPTYGAGIPSAIGETPNSNLQSQISARILAAIAQDSNIETTPAPIVTVLAINNETIEISVTVTTVAGQTVTVPSLQLQVSGG